MNKRLKELRRELRLTQQEFADKLKVPRNTIAGYEVGKSNPSDAAVNNICREFNVNEEWLRTGEGEMFKSLDREAELAIMIKQLLDEDENSFKAKLLSVLAHLTEDQWELLADIAQKMADEG